MSLSNGCYRYCGSDLPPDLTSTGPMMSVVFVADEGVADIGFHASYQVNSLSESEYYMGDDYMLRPDRSLGCTHNITNYICKEYAVENR